MHWINKLQSTSIEKVSFYRLTTKFAEHLKNDTQFDTVQVVGHSLGGGLAMITGAQAKLPSVGLSGPNALISGKSFDPPVLKEDLNKVSRKCWLKDRQNLENRILPVNFRVISNFAVHLQHCPQS